MLEAAAPRTEARMASIENEFLDDLTSTLEGFQECQDKTNEKQIELEQILKSTIEGLQARID